MTFHVHTDSQVDGLVAHGPAVAHFNVNAVESVLSARVNDSDELL